MKKLGRVENLIKGKHAKERADIKGKEIEKIKKIKKTARKDCHIEIVEMQAIAGGVQVFARCWDKDGKQWGFGKDGTVDIERFRFINPPILVPDGTKTLKKMDGKDVLLDNFKEDKKEALLQALEHTVSVIPKQKGKIVRGKRGNTVTTVYPDANVESTSVDGFVRRGTNESWSSKRTGAGDNSFDAETTNTVKIVESTGTNWNTFDRIIVLFDTSSIADTDVVDSAIFSGYVYAKTDDHTDSISLVDSTPASNTALVNADYGQVGTTLQASAKTISSITTSAYNDWTLNATGEASITFTGVTKFGLRVESDRADSEPTKVANLKSSSITIGGAELSGTTTDPKLVVTHSAAATAEDSMAFGVNF